LAIEEGEIFFGALELWSFRVLELWIVRLLDRFTLQLAQYNAFLTTYGEIIPLRNSAVSAR